MIRAILSNPNDPTHATLIYSNKTEEDILFRKELEEAAKDPRIKIYHTLSKVAKNLFFKKLIFEKGSKWLEWI